MNRPTEEQSRIIEDWDAMPWKDRPKRLLPRAEAIAEGLAIFIRHGGAETAAEHDVFYAGCDGDLSDDEVRELLRLGWGYHDDCDSWAAFT
jgi:hypothetical protein